METKVFAAKVNLQAFYATIFEIIFQVIKLDIVWKINSCNENANHADLKVSFLESNYWPPVLLSANITGIIKSILETVTFSVSKSRNEKRSHAKSETKSAKR